MYDNGIDLGILIAALTLIAGLEAIALVILLLTLAAVVGIRITTRGRRGK